MSTKEREALALGEAEMKQLAELARQSVNKQNQEDMSKKDTPILHEGKHIKLPADPTNMDYDTAIDTLERRRDEENEQVEVNEVIDAMPWDGAVAFTRALMAVRGWFGGKTMMSFFGPIRPQMITVAVGHNKHVQVLWGNVEVPGIEGYLTTNFTRVRGRMCFQITGTIKRKNLAEVREIAEATRLMVKTHSIYRGQAFRLDVDKEHPERVNLDEAPEFLDVSKAGTFPLVFGSETQTQIETNIWAPIRFTNQCRKAGVPLKRGCLLEGPYGVGKTQTATETAAICVENGWTFILLSSVSGLREALQIARNYQPCVVFAEDIDRAVFGDNRTMAIDDVLNTIDGVESKNTEIFTVLTTNHLENINQALLRPGRLDAIINVRAPDAETAIKLVKAFGKDRLIEDTDLTEAGQRLEGHIPATIREAVERAKLFALNRSGGKEFKLSGEDIVHSINQLEAHAKLLERKEAEPTPAEVLYAGLQTMVNNSELFGQKQAKEMDLKLDYIKERV